MEPQILPNTVGLDRMLTQQAERVMPPVLAMGYDGREERQRHERNNLARHLVSLRGCIRMEPLLRENKNKGGCDVTRYAESLIPQLKERLTSAIRDDLTGMEKMLCDTGMFYTCISGEDERVHLTRQHYIVVG